MILITKNMAYEYEMPWGMFESVEKAEESIENFRRLEPRDTDYFNYYEMKENQVYAEYKELNDE